MKQLEQAYSYFSTKNKMKIMQNFIIQLQNKVCVCQRECVCAFVYVCVGVEVCMQVCTHQCNFLPGSV